MADKNNNSCSGVSGFPRFRYLLACIVCFVVFLPLSLLGQRGKIIRSATSTIMDPNQDGFVSKFNTGFSTDGYNVDEFEIPMFGIPKVGTGDATGDNVGPSCGITDLIPDNKGFAVYAVRDGANNLIFRFRTGDDNPSVEAWSILLDTDGLFGASDPNSTTTNPGFEIAITLIKRNNAGVNVYNIDGAANCPSPLVSYPISSVFQISIADEVSCGDPDYFYDFFVPFGQIASTFGISVNTGVRFAAVTNVSATCPLGGQIGDVGGVNDNVAPYAGCHACAFNALVNNQCPTALVDLCATCGGFEKDKVNAPTIDLPVRAGQTIISGSSDPDIYLIVETYSRIGGTDAAPVWSTTPRETKSNYAVGTVWAVTLSGPLQAYDKIIAKAQKNINSVPCGADGSNLASASVTVVQPNTAPSCQSQTVSVTEDVAKSITLVGTDPENDVLTYSLLTQPAHGTLSGALPNLLYTPTLNYNGPDAFTFQVSDGIFNAVVAGTITINIVSVNDVPIANSQGVTTSEDTSIPITLTATDVDGNALSYTLVSGPSHGALSGTAPNLTYTPAANYHGADAFIFKVNDLTIDSAPATVSITVSPMNDTPVANAQSVTTNEDTSTPITLTATDVDGNALSYTLVSGPSHGTLSGTAPNLTYAPATNYHGADAFIFKVNDLTIDSAPATVSITVSPMNDTPVANAQNVTTSEDTSIPITLTATDVDGNALSYTIVSGPSHGALSGTAPNLTYTPASNYHGVDAFIFKVNDLTMDSAPASVSITVSPMNDIPVANAQSVTTNEDTSTPITLTATDVDGNALSYTLVSGPSHGTLSGTAPNLTYTPAANYHGPDAFIFKVNDGTIDSAPATVSITVSPMNDTPVANAQSITTNEDTSTPITLTATDVDGNALSYTIVSGPSHGTLSGTAPNLTYAPAANYDGPDAFIFKVNDGTIDSAPATVSITVSPMNDTPVANAQSVTTNEDTSTPITLTGSDVDGNALTYMVVLGPTNGTLSGTAPNLSYAPNGNFSGSDSFTFRVNDGTVNSSTATVSITVISLNDAPIANAQSVNYDLNTPKNILLTGSDADGNSITYILVNGPAHGVLSGTIPNLTYTPGIGYSGADSFTFKVNDGTVDSNIALISLSLTPGFNVPPVADNQSVSLPEDISSSIILTATDGNGDALTYQIVDLPLHGSLTQNGSGPNVAYLSAANFNGFDSFTFRVNDGNSNSSVKTVSITVTPVDDPPLVNNQSETTQEDTPKSITFSAADVDGDGLNYFIVTGPAHGILSGTGGTVNYTPNTNYNGNDSFTYYVNDGHSNSTTATVFILVTPRNDPPVASGLGNQNESTDEDVSKTFVLSASDPDGDALTYLVVTNPSHGTLSIAGVNATYAPFPNYNGSDSFTYKVNDGSTDSNIATVLMTINPIDDLPIVNNQSEITPEDVVKSITFSAIDVDGDGLTYIIVTNPSHGSLSGTGGTVNYTPASNYNGADSFTIKVNDGHTDSNTATVSITITPVNDPPVASNLGNQNETTIEDVSKPIILSASDPDGDALTYIIVTPPSHGTLTGTGANVTYTPDVNYSGTDNFEYKVNDGTTDSNVAVVVITITPVDDAPIANNLSENYSFNTPKSIVVTASDADGDVLVFSIVTAPLHGVLSGALPNVTYTPGSSYYGTDSFTFKANDGDTDSNIALVNLNPIAGSNVAPVAFNQSRTFAEDVSTDILLSAIDGNGDALTYTIVTQPAHGTIAIVGATATFIPAANYNGTDSFTFKAQDNSEDSNIATVSIIITPVSDAPVADNQNVAAVEDNAKTITLTGSDPDGDAITYSIVSNPLQGTLTGTGADVTYTPNANYHGTDSFTFRVNDGTLNSNTATVNLVILPVNDSPFISPIPTLYVDEDTKLQICLDIVDLDGDLINLGPIVNATGSGTLVPDVAPFNFCYVFTPLANFTGTLNLNLSATDGILSALVAVQIVVRPVNDAPVARRDSIHVLRNTPTNGNVLNNDFDIEGDPLTVKTTPLVDAANGKLFLSPNGEFTYISDRTFRGTDTVVYEVCDNGSPSLCSQATLIIVVDDIPLKVYEGVSPNGDGYNDYLRIDGIDFYTECNVQIFDRYNNLVFGMRGYDNENKVWRGTSNKGIGGDVLPEGTYFYVVDLGDGSKPIKGFVALKRE